MHRQPATLRVTEPTPKTREVGSLRKQLESIKAEFGRAGIEVNEAKTKIFAKSIAGEQKVLGIVLAGKGKYFDTKHQELKQYVQAILDLKLSPLEEFTLLKFSATAKLKYHGAVYPPDILRELAVM